MKLSYRDQLVTIVLLVNVGLTAQTAATAPFVTASCQHRQGRASGPVLSSHRGLSLSRCLLLCSRQQQCRAFNYGPQSSSAPNAESECQLLSSSLCNSTVSRQLKQHDSVRYYDVYENSNGLQLEVASPTHLEHIAGRMLSLDICTQQGRCKFPDCLQQLGEPCSTVQECVDPDNYRCASGVCACLSGYIEVDSQCYPLSQLGSACQIGQQCSAAASNSNCEGGICQCSAGYWNSGNTNCLPVRQLGESCSSAQECSDPVNFLCTSGVCSCPANNVAVSGQCHAIAQPSQACQLTEQCQAADVNSLCDAGTCSCKTGFWNSNNTECLPVRQLGESCSSAQECSDPVNFLCTSGVCACPVNNVAVSGQCHAIAQPGQTCQLIEQCQGADVHTLCDAATCVCKTGFWLNDNTECLPVRQLGESCSEVRECADPVNFLCTSGVCSCPSGLVAGGAQCYSTAQMGQSCQVTQQCQYSFAACSSSVCKCQGGYWNRDNIECRKAMPKGGACAYQEDCTTYSSRHECASGVCRERVGAEHNHGIYTYRLASGAHVKQGRVELRKSGGAWGVVCDDYWDHYDASVVCRSLGYNSGGTAHFRSAFGAGSARFYLDNVQCSGGEPHLADCSANTWGSHNCDSGEVAAVTCH